MKSLALSLIAAVAFFLFACGQTANPEPTAAPTQPSANTPDIQATVSAGAQAAVEVATVVAASVQATVEVATVVAVSVQATVQAQPTATPTPEPPTSTPEPTATPEPSSTPEPTATPEPPTSTPEPTATPEPTSAPEPTNTPWPTATPRPTSTPQPTATPQPTPTPTPILVGHGWDIPFPIREPGALSNTDGLTLRVRDAVWAEDAWTMIDDWHPLNDRPPRGFHYLLVDIQVRNGESLTSGYDAQVRLTAQAEPPNGAIYEWGGTDHCGDISETALYRDFSRMRHDANNGRRGYICFVVTHNDSGRVVLVDNGGEGAAPEDKRYWALR